MKMNHHRQLFKMLHLAWKGGAHVKYADFDEFRKAVAYHAGYTQVLTLLNGQRITIPKSFMTMTDEEFRLVLPAMRMICERLLHDLALYDVEEQVHEFT